MNFAYHHPRERAIEREGLTPTRCHSRLLRSSPLRLASISSTGEGKNRTGSMARMAVCVLFFIFLTAPVEMRLLFFSPLLASSGTLCKTCVESMFIWGNYAPLLTISAFVCSCVSAVTYCTSRLRPCTDGCTPLLRTSCVIPSRGNAPCCCSFV